MLLQLYLALCMLPIHIHARQRKEVWVYAVVRLQHGCRA